MNVKKEIPTGSATPTMCGTHGTPRRSIVCAAELTKKS